ncbi:MAG: DNA polymerase III subunit gamma/tau [Flavobacteriales bacterium]
MSANFIVSARKYRPDTWESVVGQRGITTTLRNAIASGQIAQAYLFCGPRGVGKTTCARIFSKAVNGVEANSDVELGFNIFELDAASNNSVDDIRNIVDTVRIPPQVGKYKVYIIDEVHMLSQAAFNAFLKTLEEPPAHAIFILATTEKHKILPTILSRCQVYDFNRIKVRDISEHLAYIAQQEGITAEPEALHVIAEKADGAMRDALSIFDQVVAFTGRNLTYQEVIANLNVLDYEYYFKLTDFIRNEEIANCLVLFDEVLSKGFDAHHFVVGLGSHFRNLLMCKDPVTIPLLEVSDRVAERFREQAASTDVMTLIKAIDFVNECDIQFRASKHQRLLVELLLMKLASIPYNNREGEKKKFRLKPFRAGEMKPSVGTAAPERSVSPPPAPPKESASQAAPSPVQNTGSKSPQTILTSGLVTDVPSIRTLKKNPGPQDKSIEQSGVEVSEEPTREYTQQEIEQAWNQFIQRRLTTNMQVQTTFKVAVIELQDKYRLRVAFPSATHHHYFNDHRSQLSDFLKSEFDIVGLKYEVDTQKAEEVVLSTRTDREKFSALGEKYPAIKKLSEKFQLRVD